MRRIVFAGLAIAALVAIGSAWLASGSPDGLERVAEDKGFIESAREPDYEILPGYTIPGVTHERLSTALAGVVGVAAVAAITLGAGWLLRSRRPQDPEPPSPRDASRGRN